MGEGTAADQSDGRQPAEDGRAKVAETGANAHDANVQGTNYAYSSSRDHPGRSERIVAQVFSKGLLLCTIRAYRAIIDSAAFV